jgi:IS1 family transposase
MKDWLIFAGPIVTGLLTYFLTRRKNKAQTKLLELEAAQKVVALYKDALSEVQQELAKAREEIGKLREDVDKLTKLNKKLESELRQFRKESKHATDQ